MQHSIYNYHVTVFEIGLCTAGSQLMQLFQYVCVVPCQIAGYLIFM